MLQDRRDNAAAAAAAAAANVVDKNSYSEDVWLFQEEISEVLFIGESVGDNRPG
jgi:hypothetical protein